VTESWQRSARGRPPASSAAEDKATICEIAALATVGELIESYRLRYEVYGALGYLSRFNDSRLEIDEFDVSSIPFGAFDPLSGEMIGTLRLITTVPQPHYERLVRRVVAVLGEAELAKQAFGPRPHALPSVISEGIHRQIDAFNTGRFDVQELSRTIVRPDHRGSGVSRGLMEFGLAHASRFAPGVLIGACLPEHVPMYARYGYQKLPMVGLDRFDSVGQIAHAVVCRTDVLPQPTRGHIEELHAAMAAGVGEHTLEIGRDSRALYRFASSRRPQAPHHEPVGLYG
jgi:predicted GNAT family N-acyltransferase